MQDALWLKYRPRTIDQLVGQPELQQTLRGIVSGNVRHAIRISGPTGNGKTTAARLLACHLNCTGRDDTAADPCGTCEFCTALAKDEPRHQDYEEINAADDRKIDDIRAAIERSRLVPKARYRFVVFDEAHALTSTAFKALLKPFEDSPKRTIFILCTTEAHKIPPELDGRCLKIALRRIDAESLTALLRAVLDNESPGSSIDDALLRKISATATGARSALSILDDYLLKAAGGSSAEEAAQQSAVQQAMEQNSDVVAQGCLVAIYKQLPARTVQRALQAQYPLRVAELLVQYHLLTIRSFASVQLSTDVRDPYNAVWHGQLEKAFPDTLPFDRLSKQLTIFIDGHKRMREFITDPVTSLIETCLLACSQD